MKLQTKLQLITLTAITLGSLALATSPSYSTELPADTVNICGSTGALEGLDNCGVITIKGGTGALNPEGVYAADGETCARTPFHLPVGHPLNSTDEPVAVFLQEQRLDCEMTPATSVIYEGVEIFFYPTYITIKGSSGSLEGVEGL